MIILLCKLRTAFSGKLLKLKVRDMNVSRNYSCFWLFILQTFSEVLESKVKEQCQGNKIAFEIFS